MKYSELTTEQARTCCKRHSKKCEKCPLRRTRETTDEKGNKVTQLLFCWFIIYNLASEQDKEEMINDEIMYPDEWNEFKEKYL